MALAALAAFHLLCCLAVAVAGRLCRRPVPTAAVPMLVLVPIWGPVLVCILEVARITPGRALDPAAMSHEEGERQTTSLLVDVHEHDTVPIEEALIVNDARQRRSLMLSVLNDAPAAYLDVLQTARLNDDVEVAHYAATAMAQISREGDLELQRLERAWLNRPDDAQVRDRYASYVEDYLSSGLAEGAAAQIQRRRYVELLEAQLACACPDEGLPMRVRLARALIEAGELARAEQVCAETMKRYPRSEDAWMLRVQVAAARRDGAGLRTAIEELRASGVFISAPNREVLAFWEQGAPEQAAGPDDSTATVVGDGGAGTACNTTAADDSCADPTAPLAATIAATARTAASSRTAPSDVQEVSGR